MSLPALHSHRLVAVAVLTVTTALVVRDGQRRRPANPNAPLTIRGTLPAETEPRTTLRVATYNIRGAKGRDGTRDLARIAATLGDVDLVALQEVHAGPFGRIDQCTERGRRTSMASVFCATETRWWGDSFGNGLLTRIPISGLQRLPLAGTQDRRFRNALLTFVPFRGRTVRVLSVHLDDRRDHDAQLDALCDLFLSLEEPALLLGDLNTVENDPQLSRLTRAEGVTAVIGERWPGRRPLRGVDWIIARGLRCARSAPRDLGGSDHPCLIAEFVPLEASTQPRLAPDEAEAASHAITETISAAGARPRR